jgi:hypothetical protein
MRIKKNYNTKSVCCHLSNNNFEKDWIVYFSCEFNKSCWDILGINWDFSVHTFDKLETETGQRPDVQTRKLVIKNEL